MQSDMEDEDWDGKQNQHVTESFGLGPEFIATAKKTLDESYKLLRAEFDARRNESDNARLIALAQVLYDGFLAMREDGLNAMRSAYIASVGSARTLSQRAETDPTIRAALGNFDLKERLKTARSNFEMAESYFLRNLNPSLENMKSLTKDTRVR
jgi:hypothetical protein